MLKTRNTICPFCKQIRKVVDGKELKRLREEAGLSLRKLGKEIQFSASYLCDIEKNKRLSPNRLINYWRFRKKII